MPLRSSIWLWIPLVLGLALGLGSLAHAAPGAWDRAAGPRVQVRALRSVLKHVYRASRAGKRPVVVVDIDDTVADGRARLRAAASGAGLSTAHLVSSDDLYGGLRGGALETRRDAFHKLYFDAPALTKLDTAQRGAPSFLRAVERAGGRVVYVSGRWESTRASTERYLRALELPLRRPEDLLLNPSEATDAIDWKRLARTRIASKGQPVALFDNEAEAAVGYHGAFPGARVFRLATFRFRHAPEKKPADLLVLKDFSL